MHIFGHFSQIYNITAIFIYCLIPYSFTFHPDIHITNCTILNNSDVYILFVKFSTAQHIAVLAFDEMSYKMCHYCHF